MKIHTFNSDTVKPVKLVNNIDPKLLYTGFAENFDFGLRLQTYNVINNLKDRKTNYNTAYFLSELKSLSSVLELEVPYTFDATNKFTTSIYVNGKYAYSNSDKTQISLQQLTTSQSTVSALSSEFFFTFNLSTNRFLYLTHEINDTTYYAYVDKVGSSKIVKLTTTLPSDESHIFRYNFDGKGIRLFPKYITNHGSGSGFIIDSSYNSRLEAGTTGNSTSAPTLLKINRHSLTYDKKYVNNSFCYYLSSYNKDDVNLDLSTTVESISNNYLFFGSNYSYVAKDETLSFNFLPLKNQATNEEYFVPSNHFNAEPDNINRSYEKIFGGNNQNTGFDKMYLSYNTGTKDMRFPPSKMTYFTTPSSMSPYDRLNINDSKIEHLGAVAGDNPLIADKVFKRREDVKNNYFSDDVNATYLCSWLSGNELGDKIWVDRFYNPSYSSFSDAISGTSFYNIVTGANARSTHVFDISSRLTFEPNNDYAYYHIGELDYESHLESLNNYLLSENIEILNSKGGRGKVERVKRDLEIDFDGDNFGRYLTDKKGDFSFTFWLSAQDYSKPLGYMLLGNYFEEGFGVFNTDLVTPNIYLPTGNKLLLINNDFEVYDEIEIFEGDTPITIKGVARKDIFSEFYILGENNIIYIYNSNPNLISKVTDLSGIQNLEIDDIDLNEERIYLSINPYDGIKSKYFFYDISTNETSNATSLNDLVSADTFGRKGKIFISTENNYRSFYEVDSDIETGNEIAFTSNEDVFAIKQRLPESQDVPYNLIYKNNYTNDSTNTITLTSGSLNALVTNVIVDDEDNIFTLFDTNRISKHKPTRQLVSHTELTFLNKTSKKYIDFIFDFEGKEYKKYILIVESLTDRTLLHKLTTDFNLVKTTSLGSKIINNLKLTKTVTGFNYLKKIGASKNRLKVKLKTKPLFTKTGAYKKEETIIDYNISQLVNGYNHFTVNVSTKKGFMELYVNGIKNTTQYFQPGKYILDNPLGSGLYIGAVSTPYNLNFSNRLLQKGKYFLRDIKIRGLRMYDKPLNFYEIQTHINYHRIQKDCVWSIPIGQRIYTDTIDRVFKFNIPEKVTNTYDVLIKNLDIRDRDTLNKLRAEILKELPKITPFYDEVRDVIFERQLTTDPNVRIDRPQIPTTYLLDPGACIVKYINGRRRLFFIVERGEYVVKDDETVVIPEKPVPEIELNCPPSLFLKESSWKLNPDTGRYYRFIPTVTPEGCDSIGIELECPPEQPIWSEQLQKCIPIEPHEDPVEDPDCDPPRVWDPVAGRCKAPDPCPPGTTPVYNSKGVRIRCQKNTECLPGYVWDKEKEECVIKINCKPDEYYDPPSGRCIPRKKDKTGPIECEIPGYVWNEAKDECESPGCPPGEDCGGFDCLPWEDCGGDDPPHQDPDPEECQEGEVWNEAKGECERPCPAGEDCDGDDSEDTNYHVYYVVLEGYVGNDEKRLRFDFNYYGQTIYTEGDTTIKLIPYPGGESDINKVPSAAIPLNHSIPFAVAMIIKRGDSDHTYFKGPNVNNADFVPNVINTIPGAPDVFKNAGVQVWITETHSSGVDYGVTKTTGANTTLQSILDVLTLYIHFKNPNYTAVTGFTRPEGIGDYKAGYDQGGAPKFGDGASVGFRSATPGYDSATFRMSINLTS